MFTLVLVVIGVVVGWHLPQPSWTPALVEKAKALVAKFW